MTNKRIEEEISKAVKIGDCFFCKQKKDKEEYTMAFIIKGKPVCLSCCKKGFVI